MKKDSLEKQKEDLLIELKQLRIDSSKKIRDVGSVPNDMVYLEKKLQKRLLLLEDEIKKLEEAPVPKPVKKAVIKKETKDEEVRTETDD